ncbi:ATP-binding protein [Actinoplanes sp. KI2]|uniref:ATP-binding protein n=1 Tax=Actinoplanes sp. KI2 TaxID=2983315 RepID=UPI0021D5C107|nr:ATP-binding protein [Actinoplanes sp. KI2]MCU7730461.1 ATP-binding protein [Actinoplanes sp. KI2]
MRDTSAATATTGAPDGPSTVRASLVGTAGFALAFAMAFLVGRRTALDGHGLVLVWPAVGASAVWFCAQRRSRLRWLDAGVLLLIGLVGNCATGLAVRPSVVLAVANLVEALVFAWLLGRRRPGLWGGGGSARLSAPRELGGLLAITVVAAATSAAVGVTGVWLAGGEVTWLLVATWVARHVTGMFALGIVGFWFGPAVSGFRARHGSLAAWRRTAWAALWAMPAWRVGEYVAVTVCSVLAFLAGFVFDRGMSLAFPLIILTVWAALRLRTGYLVLHQAVFGALVVRLTMLGHGPMAVIADLPTRAVLAQAYVGVIALIGLSLALSRDERAALVADLNGQKDELAGQAALLSAIIDSMDDGLSVVDAAGRVVLRNRAGVRLLGPADDSGETHRRLQRLDGTPIAAEALPHRRALAGAQVVGDDLLVRKPGDRDGRIVQVTATPLPDGHGIRSAVVLYHDVTAERRHRDQLATFAGAVAHDLQNPLTTVEGWTETAADFLDADQPAIGRARDSLARVSRAATRMRGLINDLLAYTAARDAELAPTRVELTDMVADIAAGRADAAAAADLPTPLIEVSPLDPVDADAGAVRQLLENLIGNSIKYTAPGVTPHLKITSRRRGGTVEVTIADNGIGIPAGQHEAIFDNFHRAHSDSGYAGTGLGLAICHRIVARHGGYITADDNPGGGSRFTFTLPAAVTRNARANQEVLETAPVSAVALRRRTRSSRSPRYELLVPAA